MSDSKNTGPTVTYTFDIYEHKDELKVCQQASSYRLALSDMGNYLRSLYKYDDTLTQEQTELVETIRSKFYEILNEAEVQDEVL